MERRMSRREQKGEEWHLFQRCCACMLAASCSSSLLLCRRNRPSLQTASLPLGITVENLGLPQRAVNSRTKNTRWQMRHMPGYRHTLSREHNRSSASALRPWNSEGRNQPETLFICKISQFQMCVQHIWNQNQLK